MSKPRRFDSSFDVLAQPFAERTFAGGFALPRYQAGRARHRLRATPWRLASAARLSDRHLAGFAGARGETARRKPSLTQHRKPSESVGDGGTSESLPPPAGTQIWPAMNPVCSVNGHTLVGMRRRVRVVSWWVVGRSISIGDARITDHQFPATWIPRWKRLTGRERRRIEGGARLCADLRSAAQHCRSHGQSQCHPLHLNLPSGHPRTG
jgi:hypothetical protein